MEHELYSEGHELVHIQFFYSNSHIAQLLHNVLISFFFITILIPFTNVIKIVILFSHSSTTGEEPSKNTIFVSAE